jgi:hypothetical protein
MEQVYFSNDIVEEGGIIDCSRWSMYIFLNVPWKKIVVVFPHKR